MLPVRMWVNAPSKLDTFNHLHGTNVLAVRETESTYRAYFLSGSVISQQIPKKALSRGWNTQRENM